MKTKLLSLLTLIFLVSCEAPYVGEVEENEESTDANITLHVSGFQMIPFDDGNSANLIAGTRADQSVSDLCTRLTFVVYQGESKYRSLAQKQDDTNFGTASFDLPAGKYTFAIIGYSGDGACTVSSLEKISFKNNHLTDTFLYCEELEVTDQPMTHDVRLTRVVAMFRLNLTDEKIPSEVKQMKFYYTGGSSTLSALTSFGSVNSKQTEKIDVTEGQRVFEVYTIPHEQTDNLKMTITALDANGNTVREQVFESVPVQVNKITTYSGNFFEGSTGPGEISFGLTADGTWDEGTETSF